MVDSLVELQEREEGLLRLCAELVEMRVKGPVFSSVTELFQF